MFAYRSAQVTAGKWIDPEKGGKVVDDESHFYAVALPEDRIHVLRAIVARIAVSFDQECIYLSIKGEVEFVNGGDSDGLQEE